MANKTKPGRGWHGDSIAHAIIGKRGGEARARTLRQKVTS